LASVRIIPWMLNRQWEREMVEKILVTGATGQIGSELVPLLRSRSGKDNVIASGHRKRPSLELEDGGPFVSGDVSDPIWLRSLIKKEGVTTIYHMASILSAIGEQDPQLAWQVNIQGLYNVLENAREHGTKVFWPSSIAVFGSGYPRDSTPQETVLLPSTMYGVTKVAGELLCHYYHHKFGVDVRSVRYPGIISAATPPGGGTTDYAVAIFYEAIRHQQYECFVREDTVLPMMYMPDCLDAAVQMMEAPSERVKRHDGYNLNALSFSAGQLAQEIRHHVPGLKVVYKPDHRQAIADSWPRSLDDSAAREDWGWKPKWNLAVMTDDMLDRLMRRHSQGKL
jgi:nucleoside-diphosphate-sugar epimerase